MSFDWWTFGLQAANVLILLALLRHFLFRPVAGILEQRRQDTAAALATAAAARQAARDAETRATAEADSLRTQRETLLAQARDEAETLRQDRIAAARAEAARIIADGRAAMDHETRARADQRLHQTADLALAVARRALAAQPAGLPGYATRLADLLAAMPAPQRAALLQGTGLHLVSASPPDAAERAAIHAALAPYVDAPRIETDPGLIAGLDLCSDTGIVRNALDHDIDRIARALHDDQTR